MLTRKPARWSGWAWGSARTGARGYSLVISRGAHDRGRRRRRLLQQHLCEAFDLRALLAYLAFEQFAVQAMTSQIGFHLGVRDFGLHLILFPGGEGTGERLLAAREIVVELPQRRRLFFDANHGSGKGGAVAGEFSLGGGEAFVPAPAQAHEAAFGQGRVFRRGDEVQTVFLQ